MESQQDFDSKKNQSHTSAEDAFHGEALPVEFPAEIFRAPTKKFRETVVLVPFYGSKKSSMHRHIEFLNELGYDVCWFKPSMEPRKGKNTVFASSGGVGVKHIWADQVERVFNEIPGNKIVFGFSNPSASAIEAVVRRNAQDIKALICDSGPSGQLLLSMSQYFTQEEPIRFWPLKALAAAAMTLVWSPQFLTEISEDMKKLPLGFRILSIRGWKDKIITPRQIDLVFEPHPQIEWQKLSLPKAAHLNGLKDFAEEYKKPVEEFLKSVSSPSN